jgi:hypothetical protein
MFSDILPKWCIKLKITVAHLCNMIGLAKADRFWQIITFGAYKNEPIPKGAM